MLRVQKDLGVRLLDVIGAWETMCPDKVFYGLTLGDFKLRAQPFLDARNEIVDLETQVSRAVVKRDVAAVPLIDLLQGVVSAVKGDPTLGGHNGEVYAAMGYVPKNQRSTGLVRRRKDEKSSEGGNS